MLVSIVIPCYNVANFIGECLDSALAQTYPDIEIICVDDGSRDDTVSTIQDYAQRNRGRIRIIEGPHAGASAARNRGWQSCQGSWIQFLDADDLLLPQKIQHQVAMLSREAEPVDWIVAASKYLFVNGQEVVVQPNRDDPWVGLVQTRLGNTCANLWSRALLERIGGWNEQLKSSQEYDLMFKVLGHKARMLYDEEPLTLIRERHTGDSISQANRAANSLRVAERLLRVIDYLSRQEESNPPRLAASRQALFDTLRRLSLEGDFDNARRIHDAHIKGTFRPQPSLATTPFYLACYSLFGFAGAEKLKKLMAYLGPRKEI
mgnify:CR=1 FL=1